MIKRIMTLVASIALSSLFAVQVSAAEVSVPVVGTIDTYTQKKARL